MFVAALCGRDNASCHSPRQERTSGLRPRPEVEAGALSFGGGGKSMILTFGYGVMYILSFATIITVLATAIALAVLLVMIACHSIWRLLRRRSLRPVTGAARYPPRIANLWACHTILAATNK